MAHLSIHVFLFLVISGFIAAFIDSIVGGGGLISLPAILLTGIPASEALGTNKLAGTMSSLTSTISYFKSGKIQFRLVRYLFPLSVIGSVLGAYVVRQLPSSFLKPMVIVLLLLVTVYTIFKKDWGSQSTFRGLKRKTGILCAVAALVIGFYDGFFGPGTGSFLIFTFLLLGFEFVEASGNAKALNFGSNIGSLITFVVMGDVHYLYGVIMGASMVAGAVVGSQFAIRKGVKLVKPIFILVTLALVGRQLWGLL